MHLSEIYDFLKDGCSSLNLDKEKLSSLQKSLGIDSLEMKIADLDFIRYTAKENIDVKIYEDGLIVLGSNEIKDATASIAMLTAYYETALSNSISYIFSLGAPIPKKLTDIKTI